MPLKLNAAHARKYQKPLWLGNEEISGKTIFVYWEQGFGNTFLLFSYIKLLKKYHINVIFQVVKSVLTLLKHMSNDAEIIGLNDQIPEFDFRCPLLSLLLSFRIAPKSILSNVPYLKADPTLVDQWASRLGVNIKERIGLLWRGSSTHKNDQNMSIDLSYLLKVLNDKAEFFPPYRAGG